MARKLSGAAAEALAATDWKAIDAMTDSDIARQIAANRDAAPDMAQELDVRAIRRSTGVTRAEFAGIVSASERCRNGSGAPCARAAGRGRSCARSRPIQRACGGRWRWRELWRSRGGSAR